MSLNQQARISQRHEAAMYEREKTESPLHLLFALAALLHDGMCSQVPARRRGFTATQRQPLCTQSMPPLLHTEPGDNSGRDTRGTRAHATRRLSCVEVRRSVRAPSGRKSPPSCNHRLACTQAGKPRLRAKRYADARTNAALKVDHLRVPGLALWQVRAQHAPAAERQATKSFFRRRLPIAAAS